MSYEDDERFERFQEWADRARQRYEAEQIEGLEKLAAQTTSDECPPPLTGHPYYLGRPIITEWLNGTSSLPEYMIRIPVLRSVDLVAADTEAPAFAPSMDFLTMTKQRAWGPAPWTGRPFHYEWNVGTDNLGRRVAGESRIVYEEGLRLWQALGDTP